MFLGTLNYLKLAQFIEICSIYRIISCALFRYLIRPPKPNATPIPQRRRLPPKPVNFRRASIRRCSVNVANGSHSSPSKHNSSTSHQALNHTGSNTLIGFGGIGGSRGKPNMSPGIRTSASATSALSTAIAPMGNHVSPRDVAMTTGTSPGTPVSTPPSKQHATVPEAVESNSDQSIHSNTAEKSPNNKTGLDPDPSLIDSTQVPTIVVRSPSPVMLVTTDEEV